MLILFGHKYDAALAPLIWLGVMQAVRIAKSGASVVALARGETWNPTVANLARVLTLPLAFLAVSHGAELLAVIWIAIAGESLGLIVAFHVAPPDPAAAPRPRRAVPALGPVSRRDLRLHGRLLARPEIFGNFHPAQLILVAALLAAFLGLSNLRNYLLARLRG